MTAMRREWIARVAVAVILIGLPTVFLGYEYVLRPLLSSVRVIDITAAVPEAGGFQPAEIIIVVVCK